MSKIRLADEILHKILEKNYDEETMVQYYERALNDGIVLGSSDSLLKFLFIAVRFYDDKLFCKTKNDPMDFFGMSIHNKDSEYGKYLELLDRTYFEILKCEEEGVPLPPKNLLTEFFERYTHALYMFGYYYKSLEFCRKTLENDGNNPLSFFLKASIVELCYINKTDDLYKIALYNYQQELLQKCDLTKTWIDVRICNEVRAIADMRVEDYGPIEKAIRFKRSGKTFEETKATTIDWTDEKEFYLRNRLFLNPLNMFETYIAAAIEEFEPLDISQKGKNYFDAILEDYKLCRKKLYEHCTETNKVTKNELAMIYSYVYTVFDKLAFLLKEVYNLDIDAGKVEFTDEGLFNLRLKGSSVLFKEIKNDNIWPLYLIMKDIRKKSNLKKMEANTFNLKKTRNYVEHRSVALVKNSDIEKMLLILLEKARDAILHTYTLIHTFSKEIDCDKVTTVGTSFHWAAMRIVERRKDTDLIIK